MPFPESLRQRETEKATKCAICLEPAPEDAYLEAHSITSLHLVLDKDSGGNRYIVTDPPTGHEILRGRTISAKAYLNGQKDHDAVCICAECHDEIHRIALAEARLDKNFRGKSPSPKILEEVTLFFIKRGKPLVYENINNTPLLEQ